MKELILFKTADEKVSVDVRFEVEFIWLTLDDIAKLYEKIRSTVYEHILNTLPKMKDWKEELDKFSTDFGKGDLKSLEQVCYEKPETNIEIMENHA